MTVLGSGNDDKEEGKSGDKVLLVTEKAGKVCGGIDATVLPKRTRLVNLRKRRSLFTVALVIGSILVMAAAIFFMVCFVRKIGPFKRHFHGTCPVGNKKFNGHRKVFESYEITDKYALIHVPKFNFKHGTFDSVRTLHVFDKKVTVIQHNGKCFVKPMMQYQMLRSDWFDKLRMLSHHHFHTPNRFEHFYLRILRPQLPVNYLKDEVHNKAEAICNHMPVFRLVFQISPNPHPSSMSKCDDKCKDCKGSEEVHIWKIIGGRKCKVCHCKRKYHRGDYKRSGYKKDDHKQLNSINENDPNCKTIRCENKCVNKEQPGCVKCKCVDPENVLDKKVPLTPLINPIVLSPMIINDHEGNDKDTIGLKPILSNINRKKRSAVNGCKELKIYEGYTPLDHGMKVPVDHIYDC